MNIDAGEYHLSDLAKINVVVGKNGCGKSTLLKAVDVMVASQAAAYGPQRYITPERGGVLSYQPNVEQNILSNQQWMSTSRRNNQFGQFREQTVVQYRTLETQTLRAFEASVLAEAAERAPSFDAILDKINGLLENIEIRRGEGAAFTIHDRETENVIDANAISSGESELISLAIENLVFALSVSDKKGLLLLDEPDVHLHPDLQVRLMEFLIDLVETYEFTAIIATHSTALLSGIADYPGARLALMKPGDKTLQFTGIDDEYRKILPVFGAHPLSNIFNTAPILLLEGEDDERIWQQAVRTAQGRLKLYPVVCGSVDTMNDYEVRVNRIANAVYDSPTAYSLRDRDDGPEEIDDLPPTVRTRLSCRSAENLILSDEVLAQANTSWEDVQSKIDQWLEVSTAHPRYAALLAFKQDGYDRKSADLKEVRQLLIGEMMASNKRWEVVVGQTIGQITSTSSPTGSLQDFLGSKTVSTLLNSLVV